MNVLEDIFPNRAEADASVQVTVPPAPRRALLAGQGRQAAGADPAFPGTNCEVDTARAFERAGAIPQIVIVNNLSSQGHQDTIDRLARGVANSQIVMLPGGSPAATSPTARASSLPPPCATPRSSSRSPSFGGARRPDVGHLQRLPSADQAGPAALRPHRRGPAGRSHPCPSTPWAGISPCLACHQGRLGQVPWLANCQVGDVHAVAFSHGEGRFVADEAHVRQLAENGQIAFQYVDEMGNPSMDITWNPNGSVCAIEGITSPDGRILGKMGHSSAPVRTCSKTSPATKTGGLFAAGVDYFR